MQAFDFHGKTVLVVGGSSGIGNGIAQAFRRCGAEVFVWGTRASATDYSSAEGSDLAGLNYACVDVADAANVESYVAPFATLDVLVQSQGTVMYARREFEMSAFQRVMDINLNSVMACAVKFRPLLAKTAGSIVNLSSVAAYRSTVGNPAYSASKTGVMALTRTLAQAWARESIRVNAIAPGLVETKLTKVTTDHPERLNTALKSIPLGRLGTVEDMSNAVLFLASPLAAYVTGQTLVIDGGATL